MVVPDFLFDVLLFGLVGVALLLDFLFPSTFHGVATALVLALIALGAASDLSRGLTRRGVWSQDSLASSLALCALGYLFFFGRNDADIVLVALSIGLMMASLMALIAIVACIGECWNVRSATPLAGLLLTVLGALALGIGAGLLALLLTSALPIAWRAALVVIGFAAWKVRGLFQKNAAENQASTRIGNDSSTRESAASVSHSWLLPQRGTLLDRVLPLLVLGALAFAVSDSARHNLEPTSGAQAQTAQAQTVPAQTAPAQTEMQTSP